MNFSKLTETELKEALMLKEKLDGFETQDKCQNDFLFYVEHMWPEFICGRHHKIFAEANNCASAALLRTRPRNFLPLTLTKPTSSENASCIKSST